MRANGDAGLRTIANVAHGSYHGDQTEWETKVVVRVSRPKKLVLLLVCLLVVIGASAYATLFIAGPF